MDEKVMAFTIVGMMVVTFLPRVMPVWFLSSRGLPPLVVAWLRFVPSTVLAALTLPALVMQEGKLVLGWNNLYLLAGIPTLLVAWRTRSLFVPLLTGMGLVALARLLGWG
jgi:branched-subunit amino acid transport protein